MLIAGRLLEYNLPNDIIFFCHIDELLVKDTLVPELQPGLSEHFQKFLAQHEHVHIVLFSHESADVCSILAASLVGHEALDRGQVSVVYEAGLGIYQGSPEKVKKDYTEGMRTEVVNILERMAIAAAARFSDSKFKDRFYFASTEFSLGIRVHPFARGLSGSLDKEAALELVGALATSLADIVKEDMQAVQNHIINYFLAADPGLDKIFSKQNDERVWDKERVDTYLDMLRFVHMGARGSAIRPNDTTDTQAAKSVLESLGSHQLVVVSAESASSQALFEWALEQEHRLVACSETADAAIKTLVESRGGIEYTAGKIEELLHILHVYITVQSIGT